MRYKAAIQEYIDREVEVLKKIDIDEVEKALELLESASVVSR